MSLSIHAAANRRGIIAMTGAMASFVVNDALVKYVSESLPGAQLIFIRGAFATLLLLGIAHGMDLLRGPQARIKEVLHRPVLIRSALDAAATLVYLTALFHLPLANAIAINMATPLFISLIAVAAFERLGSPEGELALAEACVFLAVAAKSNAVYRAYKEARKAALESGTRPVPLRLRNAPTKLMKNLGYGEGYRYAHDEAGGFAAGETYFPDDMKAQRFYEPVDRGMEAKIKEKMDGLRAAKK